MYVPISALGGTRVGLSDFRWPPNANISTATGWERADKDASLLSTIKSLLNFCATAKATATRGLVTFLFQDKNRSDAELGAAKVTGLGQSPKKYGSNDSCVNKHVADISDNFL